ncbi:MAG: XdhC family protein [Bacteroidota bacterium]|nr:XdhC family protein [Bacteroidota bacterium]
MQSLFNILQCALEKREQLALCTVVETSGSTPLKAGAKMLIWANGDSAGTIGGGNVESQVIADAIKLILQNESKLIDYALLKQNMCCGGTMKIFIEPQKPQKQLIVFGSGHIGSHVAFYAQKLQFKTILIDERSKMLDKTDVPDIQKFPLNHKEAFSKLLFDSDTYVIICTHQHEYDREILAYCINQNTAYLGMIGSMRKILITKKRFLEHNICSKEQLDRVDMPMGFDIGQNGPEEIALGIVAKIVAVSNQKEIIQKVKTETYEEASFDSNGCS